MYVTKKADYAVRCVICLSRRKDAVSNVEEISAKTLVSKAFLSKILQRLVKAGIVTSIRGVKGGFQLVKSPREISLIEVIEAVQGASAANVCAIDKKMCAQSGRCTVHPVWVDLRKKIELELKKQNFEKLSR